MCNQRAIAGGLKWKPPMASASTTATTMPRISEWRWLFNGFMAWAPLGNLLGPRAVQVLVLAAPGDASGALKNRRGPPIIQRYRSRGLRAARRDCQCDIIGGCGMILCLRTGRTGRRLPASTCAPWTHEGTAADV